MLWVMQLQRLGRQVLESFEWLLFRTFFSDLQGILSKQASTMACLEDVWLAVLGLMVES